MLPPGTRDSRTPARKGWGSSSHRGMKKMDYLVMLRLWTNALCVSARAPPDALQCGRRPGAHHSRIGRGRASRGRIKSGDAHDKIDATLISGRRLEGEPRRLSPARALPPTRYPQERGGEDRRGRRALIWLRLFFGLDRRRAVPGDIRTRATPRANLRLAAGANPHRGLSPPVVFHDRRPPSLTRGPEPRP